YQFSGIMGADFDDGRGNVSLALSINTREASFQNNRDWYQEQWNDPLSTTGAQFFPSSPGVILSGANPLTQAGIDYVNNTLFPNAAAGPALTGFGYNMHFNPDGTAWTGTGFNQRRGTQGFNAGPLDANPYKSTAIGTISEINDSFYLILPLTRYNAFARGNYEINDWVGVFGQALFSHVNTYTRNEPGPITNGWDVFMPYGTGVYVGSNPYPTNGQVFGTGNPSSVILNGQPLSGLGSGT